MRIGGAAAPLVAAMFAGASAQAQTQGQGQVRMERFATCHPCHGEGGVSHTVETPSLAGQHSFYAITRLFLFTPAGAIARR
jgi:cytochrome c553